MFKEAILSGLIAGSGALAGEFVNLDFGNPNLNGSMRPLYPGGPMVGRTSDLLPGWQLTADGNAVVSMTYSAPGAPGGQIPAALYATQRETGVQYFLTLISRYDQPPDTLVGPVLQLSQSGLVPRDAVGLKLELSGYIQMFLNGRQVDDSVFLSGSPIVDVSAYRGEELAMSIVVPSGVSAGFRIAGFTQVPEPAESILAVLAGGLLVVYTQTRSGRTVFGSKR